MAARSVRVVRELRPCSRTWCVGLMRWSLARNAYVCSDCGEEREAGR